MHIGYARVSTHEQHLDSATGRPQTGRVQKRSLSTRSAAPWPSGPVWRKSKSCFREGDTLVVWRLDRLGRSIKDLIAWMGLAGIRRGWPSGSLHESIDSIPTPSGKLTFHIFAALAEFERQLIQERTQAGLKLRLGPEGAAADVPGRSIPTNVRAGVEAL